MPIYTVYVEFFGKKLKCLVNANNYEEAVKSVKNRLNILRVENQDGQQVKSKPDFTDNDIFDFLKGFKQ